MSVQSNELDDSEMLPFVMGYLPESFKRKAEVELRDSPENRERGIRLLREMMKSQKSMSNLELDDDFLLQYLLSRKFDVERAFSQLKAFVQLQKTVPEAFRNFEFDRIVQCVTKDFTTFLPWRCQDGCAIIYTRMGNWDPSEFPVDDAKRMTILILLQALRDPMTQVNGFKAIFDFKNSPIRHLRHFTPHNVYLLYHGTQDCIPGRFKEIHYVNGSLTFRISFAILKNFLSAKLKKRIHIHASPETLLNYFPRAAIPKEYGGLLEDYDMTEWLRDVMQPDKLATIGGGSVQLT